MVLSELQIRSILLQLGVPSNQITKELIEEIQLNCKSTMDLIDYANKVVLKKQGRRNTRTGTNTLEGILIAASEEPRFDTFFEQESRKPISFRDYKKIQYVADENCYVLVESEENIKVLNAVEYYIGYLLTPNEEVILLKSNKPLPTTPHYVKVAGRQYSRMFVVHDIPVCRELSEMEWEKLNEFIDNGIEEAPTKLSKECSAEPLVFIGRIVWSGVDKDRAKGVLDLKTAFRVGYGGSEITLFAYSVAIPRDVGIFIGLLNAKKRVLEDGRVIWMRSLIHPVKVHK